MLPGQAAWYQGNNGFPYRLKVTPDHIKIGATLTDFPVGVNLTDLGSGHGFWTHVLSTGADIRATKADGKTEVPIEVASINTTTKKGEVYFKANGAVLNATTNASYYLYYGNADATMYTNGATFGKNNVWESGFKGVWHMGQASGTLIDSTASVADLTQHNSPVQGVVTKMGHGAYFDGTNDYFDSSDADLNLSNDFTVETLANGTTFSVVRNVVSFGNNLSTQWRELRVDAPNYAPDEVLINTGATERESGSGPVSTNTYYNLSMTLTSANNGLAYINGVASNSAGAMTITGPAAFTYIVGMGIDTTSRPWLGIVDEVRLSTGQRATTWMTTVANNLTASSTFYVIGIEESNGVAATTSSAMVGSFF